MIKFRWEKEFKETEIGEIPKDWESKPLKDVVIMPIKDGGTPSRTKNAIYFGGNIPWVTVKDIKRYIYDTEEHLTDEGLKNSSAKLWPVNTIIFSFGATIGEVGIAKVELTTKQSICGICLDPQKADIGFYYYLLSALRQFFNDLASGSTFGEVRPPVIEKILFPYPPLVEQTRIANVLSWFDDLIENKKRQNEILEKTAMAIFKNWFIDFEPFKNEEFVYNEELGREIPKGWVVKKSIEIIEYKPSVKLEFGKLCHFVEMKDVSTKSLTCEYSLKEFTGSGVKYYSGDTLLARITPSLENGKTAYVWFVNEHEKGFATTEFFVLHPRSNYLKEFAYLLAKSEDFRELAINSMSGTSGRQRADINALKNYLLPLPPSSILQKFHSVVEPLFQKIILNQKEIMALRKVRDTLLPLLVFGKLRIEEV
jgi:type I restriction enzyme S subunit